MKAKRVAPEAIQALKEALANIYWYKGDLRSFLTASIQDAAVLAPIDWGTYKYQIASALVDRLVAAPDHQSTLLRLMADVSRVDNFNHLARLEDADAKIRKAQAAVAHLRSLVLPHQKASEALSQAEERRARAHAALMARQSFTDRLAELNQEFLAVITPAEAHDRGYRLERLLRGLFELFDLDPKASFQIIGEQIDGAFTFDKTDYLLEAKWQRELVGTADLDSFEAKISRKLENTLGLGLAINGFATSAVQLHSTVRPSMILMDGSDLMAVLEGRVDLQQLLLRKRRHAAQTGEIYLPI